MNVRITCNEDKSTAAKAGFNGQLFQEDLTLRKLLLRSHFGKVTGDDHKL